jgi:hypothetical protein
LRILSSQAVEGLHGEQETSGAGLMNTKALVAVIAFVAAASAMAQFKSGDTQLASASLAGSGLSMSGSSETTLRFEGTGRASVRLGGAVDTSTTQSDVQQAIKSERLSFPEPGKFAMLLAGLGVIGFVAGRRQQS